MDCPKEYCDFSSSEHGVKVHVGRTHSKNSEKCDECGDKFYRAPAKIRGEQNSFCSVMCKNEYRTGNENPNGTSSVEITCAECGSNKSKPKSVAERGQAKHFCNESCMVTYWRENEVQSGEDNPMYGGVESSWRSRSKWRNIREDVIRRDLGRCQWCNARKISTSITMYPSLRVEINTLNKILQLYAKRAIIKSIVV